MSPVPATPPAVIEQAKQNGQALLESFRLTGEAVRRILSTRKLLLSKKAQRRHLEEAVNDFERQTKEFRARLQSQQDMLVRLARENDRLRRELHMLASEDRNEASRPLFFTHAREAWNILRGHHA